MTEPVERWIRRAAERCVTVGFSELARALKGHAQAEAGHHLMMIADVRSLAARWNACRKHSVDAGELLKEAPSQLWIKWPRLSDLIRRFVRFNQTQLEGRIYRYSARN
jgi:hypothetical protein